MAAAQAFAVADLVVLIVEEVLCSTFFEASEPGGDVYSGGAAEFSCGVPWTIQATCLKLVSRSFTRAVRAVMNLISIVMHDQRYSWAAGRLVHDDRGVPDLFQRLRSLTLIYAGGDGSGLESVPQGLHLVELTCVVVVMSWSHMYDEFARPLSGCGTVPYFLELVSSESLRSFRLWYAANSYSEGLENVEYGSGPLVDDTRAITKQLGRLGSNVEHFELLGVETCDLYELRFERARPIDVVIRTTGHDSYDCSCASRPCFIPHSFACVRDLIVMESSDAYLKEFPVHRLRSLRLLTADVIDTDLSSIRLLDFGVFELNPSVDLGSLPCTSVLEVSRHSAAYSNHAAFASYLVRAGVLIIQTLVQSRDFEAISERMRIPFILRNGFVSRKQLTLSSFLH